MSGVWRAFAKAPGYLCYQGFDSFDKVVVEY